MTRNLKLDALKVIAIICIIIAHSAPPQLLFQLRNFDVPLMAIISGALFSLTSYKYSYIKYVTKRILRLLIPTYTFLLIFFTSIYLFTLLRHQSYPFSNETIRSTFTLHGGIGFVWIIRVYLLIAVISPVLLNLYRRINTTYFTIFLIITYILYEITYFFLRENTNIILQYFIFYMLPFGVITGFGIQLLKLSTRTLIHTMCYSFSLFTYLSFIYYLRTGNFVQTQDYKYPPQIYYLSFALSICIFLYLLLKIPFVLNLFKSKYIYFISSSSLWIYLWQIFYVYIWNTFRISNFVIEFIFVFTLSCTTVYIQKVLIQKIIERFKWGKRYTTTLEIMFLK